MEQEKHPEFQAADICLNAMKWVWNEMEGNKGCQAADCESYANAMLSLVKAMIAPFNPR